MEAAQVKAARTEAALAEAAEAKAAPAEAAEAARAEAAWARVQGTWSPAEDAQLARAALRGCRGRARMPWMLIAAEVEGRDAKACRERWVNHLCPLLNHSGVWSEAEDAALLRLVERHGNKYAKMTRLLGTRRSRDAVKNRVLRLTRTASACTGGGGAAAGSAECRRPSPGTPAPLGRCCSKHPGYPPRA